MLTIENPFENKANEIQDKVWRPTHKQQRLIQLPWDVDEALYGGALMAGKSDVLMMLPLIYGFHENPQFKGLFLRRTFPELEQEIIPRSTEYYPSAGGIYNIQKHTWEFKSGAKVIFGHLKDEKDVKKYDTGQFPLMMWDESTSFTPYQYEYLVLRRNRAPVGSGLPSFSRAGSNPGNVGHTYFRKRFIDPYKQGGQIIRDAKTKSLRIYIPATLQDNPHALEANPKYAARLASITSEAERRAMILGDWYTFEGQVFEEFRLEPLSDEPSFAQHVIEPFAIPSWWPKIMGIDWGMAAYTFVIWAAISPDGRVYIYRTYAVKKVKISQWTREIAVLSRNEINEIEDVRICFSAGQDRGQDQTIFEQVAESLEDSGFQCSVTLGDRGRVAGKQLVHEYLRWKPLQQLKEVVGELDVELARKIERMHGTEELQKYLKYFEPPEPEYNLPKLQIFSRSPEGMNNDLLIETLPACVYDDVRKEDVKEFDGDDPYDCLRILLYAVRDFIGGAAKRFDRFKQIGKAGKQLQVDGDQTAFYRRCELAEAKEKKVVFSVRRKGASFRRGLRH